ncbi:hypothetical protein, partial [Sedimenticola hydrogenitrophicus]|uniref:hypothetical protein n=1 Tax=Sedimenticola hydrogenitrophicus TaxID=2967975 RepID=UPI0021A705E6
MDRTTRRGRGPPALDGAIQRNREVARFAAETTQNDGGSARAVTRFEYDVQNNLVKEIDAHGGETSRTWNA